MAQLTVKLTGSGAFQDIGTVGQTVAGLSGNVQSINQILDVGLRNTGNIKDSFLRVSDLVGLGIATLSGNQLTFNNAVVSYATNVAGLPANPTPGDRGFVIDATSTTFLAAAVGGGAYQVPVVYTAAGWVVG